MHRFVAVSLVLILSVCCSSPSRYNELPAISDREMAGKIVVVRTSSFAGALSRWDIALDGKGLFYIGSGEYTEFLLPEGEHYITVRCWQGCVTGGMRYEDTVKFNLKASQTNYFLVSPSLKCAKITLSNEIEAKKHIERSKFINLEN